MLIPNATLFLSPQSLIHSWGPSRLRCAWRTPSSGDCWPKQMHKTQSLLPLSGMTNQKMSRTEGALWLDLFWRVKFWEDSGQAEPRSPRFPTGSTQGGLFDFFAVAAAVAAAAAVAGGLRDQGLLLTLESRCLLLFLPEESSFFRRILTPVVLRGSPCGHLGTQWRCLSLPPIPSIKMLVSALAARCPPASGLQARSAHFLRSFWTPGPGPSSSPFLRLLP